MSLALMGHIRGLLSDRRIKKSRPGEQPQAARFANPEKIANLNFEDKSNGKN